MNNIYNLLLHADDNGDNEIKPVLLPKTIEASKAIKPSKGVEPLKYEPQRRYDKNDYRHEKIDKYDKNKKTILCKSIVFDNHCQYGDNCFYAHSLAKQKLDPSRQKIYDILRSNDKIEMTPELYSGLLVMCNLCEMCSVGACTGGYNCRNGAVSKQYQVCYQNLVEECSGNCNGLIHLSDRIIKPMYIAPIPQQKKVTGVWSTVPKTLYTKQRSGESVTHICKPVKQFQPTIFELLKTPARDLSCSESDDEAISAFLNLDMDELDQLDNNINNNDDIALNRSIFKKL